MSTKAVPTRPNLQNGRTVLENESQFVITQSLTAMDNYLEPEEIFWVSPGFMPADTYVQDCPASSLECHFPNSSLSDRKDPNDTCIPSQPKSFMGFPIVPAPMGPREWGHTGVLPQSHSSLFDSAPPKYSEQGNQSSAIYPLGYAVPTKYIDPALLEESPEGRQATTDTTPKEPGCHGMSTIESNPATSEPDKVQRGPAYRVNGEEYWNIQCFLDRRSRRKRRKGQKEQRAIEYLVRWKGYGPEYDTWEPKESLEQDVPYVVREFDAYLATLR